MVLFHVSDLRQWLKNKSFRLKVINAQVKMDHKSCKTKKKSGESAQIHFLDSLPSVKQTTCTPTPATGKSIGCL